jgi:putative FmdB family regulatory protein
LTSAANRLKMPPASGKLGTYRTRAADAALEKKDMPSVEYFCGACRKPFARLVFAGDAEAETVACPACGSINVKALPSARSIFTGKSPLTSSAKDVN